ncbi:MAG: PAS domain-containing protein, partial [bacterium]|nr:PAS domain-containing protein [bacterium]
MGNGARKFHENIRLFNLRKHWPFLLFLGAILIFNVIWLPAYGAITVSILVLILFFLMTSNIVSLARAEEVIRRERNQIFGIISRLTDGLIVYDNYFRILLINSKAEEMLNVRRERLLGKTVQPEMQSDPGLKLLVQVIFPSLAPNVKKITAQYPEVMEVSFSEPKEMEIQITTNPIIDPGGRISGYLKIIHDISRERAISRMKSEFITIAAHQLRTPLAAVKWTFQAFFSGEIGPLNEEQKNYAKDGLEVSNRLIKLTGDLLD